MLGNGKCLQTFDKDVGQMAVKGLCDLFDLLFIFIRKRVADILENNFFSIPRYFIKEEVKEVGEDVYEPEWHDRNECDKKAEDDVGYKIHGVKSYTNVEKRAKNDTFALF